jgi:hypothetical protein
MENKLQPILTLNKLLKELNPELQFEIYDQTVLSVLAADIKEQLSQFHSSYLKLDISLTQIDMYETKLEYINALYNFKTLIDDMHDVDLKTLVIPDNYYSKGKLQLLNRDQVNYMINVVKNLKYSSSKSDIREDKTKVFDQNIMTDLDKLYGDEKLIYKLISSDRPQDTLLNSLNDYWLTESVIEAYLKHVNVIKADIELKRKIKESRINLIFRLTLPSFLILGLFITGLHYLTGYITESRIAYDFEDLTRFIIFLALSIITMYLFQFILPRIFSLFGQKGSIGHLFQFVLISVFSVVTLYYHFASNFYFQTYYIQYLILFIITLILSYGIEKSSMTQDFLGIKNQMSRTAFALLFILVTSSLMYLFRMTSLYVNITLGVSLVLTAGLLFREEIGDRIS